MSPPTQIKASGTENTFQDILDFIIDHDNLATF